MVRSDGSLDEKAIRMTLPKEYSEVSKAQFVFTDIT